MNFNPFKKKEVEAPLETKSFQGEITSQTSATYYLNNKGELIDDFFTTDTNEIANNGSVSTITSNHLSIVDEATLTVREGSYSSNEDTQNKECLKFLSWLNNPNSTPGPRNKYEIFKYLINYNYKIGLAGLVFTFKGNEANFDNFSNIKACKNLNYLNSGAEVKYRASFGSNYGETEFKYDARLLNYVGYDKFGNLMMLVVFGNYNVNKDRYDPFFKDIAPYITLQNHLVNFVNSFHQEACFPSQIVQLNFKNIDKDRALSDNERTTFKETATSIRNQLNAAKGSKKAGKIFVPDNPNLDIKIIPISVPLNADENLAYQTDVSEKIFSYVDGGSASAFLGKSQYSNNASAGLLELYDGAFRMSKSLLTYPLNDFLRSLLLLNRVGVDEQELFFAFNTSMVKIYQKQEKAETVMYEQNNIISIGESRSILATFDSKVANLGELSDGRGDLLNKELNGKDSIDLGVDNNFK